MYLIKETLGNLLDDEEAAETLAGYAIERLHLDQWTAQKSRFICVGDNGTEVAVALDRDHRLADGDLLAIDHDARTALVAAIEVNPVLVIDLTNVARLDAGQVVRTCVELGHAIGNQHWPAVVKDTRVYVPLTVDRKVMVAVMDTHAIPGISYSFEESDAVIPYLSPSEVRRLLGGTARPDHPQDHAHGHPHHAH